MEFKPGIYIYLTNGVEKFIPFKDLGLWKLFASNYFVEDVNKITVKCFSLDNAQPLVFDFDQSKLEGFEACYRASKMLHGGVFRHFVVIYVPQISKDYHLVINENSRLMPICINRPNRKPLFSLKSR